MATSIASFRSELADSVSRHSEPLRPAARLDADREFLDRVAEADRLVMQRLFKDVFRSLPAMSDA